MINRKSRTISATILSGHIIGLGVARALGSMGIPVNVVFYEKTSMAQKSKYVKESIFAPHPEKNQDEFLDLLIKNADRFGRGLLIPADDATLVAVSKNKKILKSYYTVACVEPEIAELFINKKNTYKIAEEIGVPVPKTFVPQSIDALERYRDIEFPCIVKPCCSHRYVEQFSRKMTRVENFDQLIKEYIRSTDAGIPAMIQELIPGDDTMGVNYNSYFKDGKPIAEFTAEKVRLSPPGFGVPRVVVSKNIPEIIGPGRSVLKAMGFYGYSCTEFKKDKRDGKYKLMEVNGRHNRSVMLAIRCGVNFPQIEYQHLTGEKIQLPNNPQQQGIFWIEEFRDIIDSIRFLAKEHYSLIGYIRPYLKSHVFATYNLKDKRPFLKRSMDLINMGKRAIISNFKKFQLSIIKRSG